MPDGGADGTPILPADLALPSCVGPAPFSTIRASILPRCDGFGCHRTPPFAGGLDLTDVAAYANLVNVPALGAASLLRVKPGAPLDSFLWNKLDNVLSADHSQGLPMPLGPENFWSPLSGEQRALLYCWIATGAPNN